MIPPLVALFGWPVVSAVFYNRLTLPVALCATLLGGYLLLPNGTRYDLPLIPALHKGSLPNLAALLLTMIFVTRVPRFGTKTDADILPGWMPRDRVTRILIFLLVVSFFGSTFANRDTLVYGPRVIPGNTIQDGISEALVFLIIIIPLFLGRKLLSSPRGQRTLLIALSISGLLYSIPMIYEARMSPQLHMTVYGFFPHSFAQHMRGGGFRPVVFLNHGLALALYMVFALLATVGLFRIAKGQSRLKWTFAVVWLLFALVLAKSLGVLMISVVLVPIALFLRPRLQILLAACIAGIVLTYPLLRAADVVPVDSVLSLAERINPERADSLNIRISNEDALLEKARDRLVFGWGAWGRNRIFDEEGRNISITDGEWVIVLGEGGLLRYLALFGLMCWPVILLCLRHRDKVGLFGATLALILCAKLVDMLPNSGWIAVPWLIAGSLIGALEWRTVAEGEVPKEASAAQPGYTRIFSKQNNLAVKPTRDGRPADDAAYSRFRPVPGMRR